MRTLRERVMTGMAWQGAGRFSERAIRFAANVVLARLLAPDDFGMFAALLLPLAAVDSLAYLATGPVIIQAKDGAKLPFLQTIFTINCIRGLLLTLLLLPIAPLAAYYFDRPDLVYLFLVAAVQPLLASVASPGVHVLAREMHFARISASRVGSALIGVLAALILAVLTPTAWALLGGQLVGVAAATILSWAIAPIRPAWRFDADAWKVIREFALRALGTPALLMLVAQAPALLLGRLESMEVLGVFSMNVRLAEFPVYITLTVAGAVLIPAYSTVQHDLRRLRGAWLKAWAGIGFCAAPAAVLLAWMGDALPATVWGARYESIHPLMPILALNGFLSCMLAVTGPLFWGVGRPSIDRAMQVARVVAVFVVGLVLIGSFGSQGVAWALTAGLGAALLIAIPQAVAITRVGVVQLMLASMPAVAAGTLIAIPLLLSDLLVNPHGVARVVVAACVGALFGVLLLLRLKKNRLGLQVAA